MSKPMAKKGSRTLLASLAFGVAILLPAAVAALIDFRSGTLNALADAYQVVSAIVAAGALVAVAVTLRVQARQADVAQRLTVRSMHIEFMSLAMNDPETYLPCFGIVDSEENRAKFKRRSFTTLHLQRTLDLYKMGEIEEATIGNEFLQPLFSLQDGRDYWSEMRPLWIGEESNRTLGRRFVRLVDDEYEKATASTIANAAVGVQSNQATPQPRSS